jgi:hypothetical protein
MAGKLQIDWDELARAAGYSDIKTLAYEMYFSQGISLCRIEDKLGVGRCALKYHMKKWWPDMKFRGPGRPRRT